MTIQDMIAGLDNILKGTDDGSQPQLPSAVPNPMPRWQRQLATVIPRAAGNIVSAPTALYGLADAGVNWGSNKLGLGDTHLPGAEGANEITDAIQQPVQDMSAKLAGEPINDSLIHGDPAQLAASWATLGLGAMPAPASAVNAIYKGANAIKTGVDVVDNIGKGVLKAAEVLTPVTITKAAALPTMAVNVGAGAGIGIGLESLLPPEEHASDASKGAADAALAGIDKITDVKTAHTPQVMTAGFGDPSDPQTQLLAVGLGAAALFGHYNRAALYRGLTGLKEGESTALPTSTAIRANAVDAMAPLTKLNEMLGASGPAQAGFENRVAANHGTAIETRLKSAFQYGELPGNYGLHKFAEPVDDVMLKFSAKDVQDQQATIDYMNAKREMEMRQRVANADANLFIGMNPYAKVAPIGSPAGISQYVNMVGRGLDENKTWWAMSDPATGKPVPASTLMQTIKDGEANPNVMDTVKSVLNIGDVMGDYIVNNKFRTPKEVQSMRTQNPHYFMTELASGANHLQPLELVPGGGARLGEDVLNPMKELPKYIEQIVRRVEGNKTHAEMFGKLRTAADGGNQFAKDVLGPVQPTTRTPANQDQLIGYRDHNAAPQTVLIKDDLVRRAAQEVTSPGRLHMLGGMLGSLARLYENSATGAIATIGGNLFAPKAALYAATAGTVMRPTGLRAGWVDAAVQAVSGGKFGVRGDVATMVPDTLYRAGKNVSSVLMQRVGQALHHSVATDPNIIASTSPTLKQKIADALNARYMKSDMYYFQRQGMMGPAGLGVYKDAALNEYSRLIQNKPTLTSGLAKAGQTATGAIRQTSDLLTDILHAVTAAPFSSLKAMNKHMAPEELLNHMRDFTGDPGKQGSFSGGIGKAVGTATNLTPYGNILIQATDKLTRAFWKDKLGFTMGVVNGVGVPAVLAALHNADQGPEYTDHEYNVRPAERQAGSIYVAKPGAPPDEGFEIPIDPVMRPFKHAFDMLMGLHLGLADGTLHKPENADVKAAAMEMYKKRSNDTFWQSMSQAFLPPVSPVAGIPLAAAGVNVPDYGTARNIDPNRSRGFSDSTARDGNAKFLGMDVPAQMESVMRALMANFGSVVYNTFVDGSKRFEAGQSAHDILGNQWQSMQQRFGDANQYASPLFGHFGVISPGAEASAQLLKTKIDSMKQLTDAAHATEIQHTPAPGMVGGAKRGYQQLLGEGPALAADPQMQQLATEVTQFFPQFQQAHLGQIDDLYKQRTSTLNSTQFSPEEKRARVNLIAQEIMQRNRQALAAVLSYENTQSQRYGRHINLEDVKLGGSIEQFKPLLPN